MATASAAYRGRRERGNVKPNKKKGQEKEKNEKNEKKRNKRKKRHHANRRHCLHGDRLVDLGTVPVSVPVVHQTIDQPLFPVVFRVQCRLVVAVDGLQHKKRRHAVAHTIVVGPRLVFRVDRVHCLEHRATTSPTNNHS